MFHSLLFLEVILIKRKSRKKNNKAKKEIVARDKPKKKKKRRKKKVLDLDVLAKKLVNDISEYTGMDTLQLPDKLKQKITREILDIVITSTSYRPSTDTILKRIARNRELINMLIAAHMLEELNDFTDEQLEFIVYYGKRMIIPEISRLYRILVKKNRKDLISYLQYVWEKYGRPSPVKCPKCGFNAIMPDYTCYICGHTVTETYIREQIGFDEKLREFVKEASVAELREVLEYGFVFVSREGIKTPRSKIDPLKIYYQIYLKPKDIALIKEEISNRKIPV
ncbi:hypothetical protein [Staphylothermus hellenicus]|uniref:Uncharacterized protein n=1 Tax=Staphylothermus hellenicus (strain DSM 12710 / JCM 10830 / BK20S6-10-b1 / P8) TaxID=591019 RepID=D7D942_STAHD|nr:hypothetical protein [Staphylothermus hellenicus]ADI32288.1 hypothetical protein Shell_1188 [Staphylothermus hellenicus DSM 12710]